MRTTSQHLLLFSALAFAACTAGDVHDAPDHSDDPATDADAGGATTRRADAGSGSTGRAADAAIARPASDAGHHAAQDAGGKTGDEAGVGTSTGETGRMVGMTAAHNAVRAMVQASQPLPDMVWDADVAAYAQQWADQLASSKSGCDRPMHRSGTELRAKNYGENLATRGVQGQRPGSPPISTAQTSVDAWASEIACWTYGTISGTERCDLSCAMSPAISSDGCGHYTQVVWRKSIKLGCGVASCVNSTGYQTDIWICNYSPAGNVQGQAPY